MKGLHSKKVADGADELNTALKQNEDKSNIIFERRKSHSFLIVGNDDDDDDDEWFCQNNRKWGE